MPVRVVHGDSLVDDARAAQQFSADRLVRLEDIDDSVRSQRNHEGVAISGSRLYPRSQTHASKPMGFRCALNGQCGTSISYVEKSYGGAEYSAKSDRTSALSGGTSASSG